MNPLQLSKQSFAKLVGKRAAVTFRGIRLTGTVTQGYMASNPPHEPASFDFNLDLTSKQALEKAGLEVFRNFSIMESSDIEEI